MVMVKFMDTDKYTKAKDDIGPSGVCNWSEHIFFDAIDVVGS
jgi:hypothetical protein